MNPTIRRILTFAVIPAGILLILLAFVFPRSRKVQVPVLMYHHLAETCPEGQEGMTASAATFRSHMEALKAAGYETITPQQMADYVHHGTALPQKPILITFDDGYTSNLEIGAPILQELGFQATIFVIGINEGQELYAHNGLPLDPPRFSFAEAKPWVDAGVISVQSHTFDMHQLASYGFSGRDGVLPMEGESWEDYEAVIQADAAAFEARWQGSGLPEPIALAYPFGFYYDAADEILESCGYELTFTVEEHVNTLVRGKSETLRMLGRFDMRDDLTPEDVLTRIES